MRTDATATGSTPRPSSPTWSTRRSRAHSPEAVEAQLDAERAAYRREEIAGFTALVVRR